MPEETSASKWPWIVGILGAVLLALTLQKPAKHSGPVAVDPAKPQKQSVVPVAKSETNLPDPTLDLESATEAAIAERERLDETIWADEISAQQYEDTFVDLWDRIRVSEQKLAVLGSLGFEKITVRAFSRESKLSHGVTRRRLTGQAIEWSSAQFKDWLMEQQNAGMRIVQTEWHHRNFTRGDDSPDQSVISFSIHSQNEKNKSRHILAGKLRVVWSGKKDPLGHFIPKEIAAQDLSLLSRVGETAFTEVELPKLPPGPAAGMEMTLAADLNRDGYPDLAFPQINIVYWNQGDFSFKLDKLVQRMPAGVTQKKLSDVFPYMRAVVGDFSSNGTNDMALIVPDTGVYIYQGSSEGFVTEPRLAFRAERGLAVPSVTSAGDLNGDGRLDLFIGQYRTPYAHGFMPNPFYDANNSDLGYLLIQQPDGSFSDLTDKLGMSAKRNRFAYSASFVDLDGDHDLDLLTVNDFAGVDVFRNTGKGLEDISKEYLDERANFGMGHVLADFNNDARFDLYVTGMSSTTARRLESMGLKRDDFPDISKMRMRMAYGNRMYLGADSRMRQPAFLDQVARTGWAWGCAALDFANDGNLDLYVANGHVSAGSCKDYCTRYWTHDVYAQHRGTNAVFRQLYMNEWQRNSKMSWNGYEKNVLFANNGGSNFVNIGFLLNVGFAYDSRCVVAEDFDLDGRVDLAVLERAVGDQRMDHKFHVYKNTWKQNGNWIGVKLHPAPGQTVMGAKIRVTTASRKYEGVVVSGDSYRTQHSTTKHFGIGDTKEVREIQIIWPGGKRQSLTNPKINEYHTVRPLEESAG
ncbi:MAG: hypothetical protein CMO80_08985 [Verrucomicrobiales bacterium]|mgnify:CR=1 FL=1|nr:hypothetical protein [Verrucomicrobiales bacterium]